MSADVDAAADLLRAAGWEVTPPPEPPTRDAHSLAARRMARWDSGDWHDESMTGWYEAMARELRLVSLDDAEMIDTEYSVGPWPQDTTDRDRAYMPNTHQRMVIYMPATPIGDES